VAVQRDRARPSGKGEGPRSRPLARWLVETGAHTGPLAQDKYTVRDATTEKVGLVGQQQGR
jgi:hypothetical protein